MTKEGTIKIESGLFFVNNDLALIGHIGLKNEYGW